MKLTPTLASLAILLVLPLPGAAARAQTGWRRIEVARRESPWQRHRSGGFR